MTEIGPDTFFNEAPGNFIRDRRMHYLMVNALSKRVRQLQLGERALATVPDGHRDAIRVAVQEFLEDELEIVPKMQHGVPELSEPMTEID